MIRSRQHIAPDETLLVVNKFPRPSVEIEIEAIAAKSG
jgi:enamine deaminase RidA (YjgF/YER057c/UK114 family)